VTKRPRFIAGAVCPSCGATDRTVVEHDGTTRMRRCVACGFVERETQPAPPVPNGRLDRTKSTRADAESSAVRWVDAAPPRRPDRDSRERSD
jgi:uncharacterized protein